MAGEVIELESIVIGWAQQMFNYTKTKEQSKIPKDCLHYTINWKRAKITSSAPEFDDISKQSMPKSQVLFKTFFVNKTRLEQEYSFKTQRSTRSTCEVCLEKGVCTGTEIGLKLATPCEVFEANAGFHREVTVTKGESESYEHELSWEVDSQIKVPPRHKTEAQLVINEDSYSSKFTLHCRLSGKVTVTITNLQDNNSFVKSLEGDLPEIFKHEMENGLRGVKVERNAVLYDTVGKCSFRYAVEQHVRLNQYELQGDDGAGE